MSRWHRPEPPPDLARHIERKQAEVDAGGHPDLLWKRARQTRPLQRLASILASATGERERCMYCEDSRGTDIEHYRPRASFPEQMFRWLNWLWACAGCNRAKGGRFPIDASGSPLLIDPTTDDPWDFLFYESKTGEVTARWHADGRDARGSATVETLTPLRDQAVCEGRLRTRRLLGRAVTRFLADPGDHDTGPAVDELLSSIGDADDYGLVEWFLLRDGAGENPFHQLYEQHPLVWARVQDKAREPKGC